MAIRAPALIDVDALIAEIYRYLAVVDCFRREGYDPGRTTRRSTAAA
jgi:hypothetical protein